MKGNGEVGRRGGGWLDSVQEAVVLLAESGGIGRGGGEGGLKVEVRR